MFSSSGIFSSITDLKRNRPGSPDKPGETPGSWNIAGEIENDSAEELRQPRDNCFLVSKKTESLNVLAKRWGTERIL